MGDELPEYIPEDNPDWVPGFFLDGTPLPPFLPPVFHPDGEPIRFTRGGAGVISKSGEELILRDPVMTVERILAWRAANPEVASSALPHCGCPPYCVATRRWLLPSGPVPDALDPQEKGA
jgi:hypothetical protein